MIRHRRATWTFGPRRGDGVPRVGPRRPLGRWRIALTRLLASLVFLSLLPTPSGGQAPRDPEPGESTYGFNLIKVGYLKDMLPDIDPRDARVAIELWLTQAAAEMDLAAAAKVQFYENMASMVDALVEDRIDVVSLPALDYLEVRKRVALEVYTVGVAQGRVTDEHLILVREDSEFAALGQLKGAALIVESGRYARHIASMWMETLLLKEGLGDTQGFFGSVKLARRASQAVLGVLFRKHDACLVTRRAFETMAELNPQIDEELTVLRRSPGFLREVICGRTGYLADQKETLLEGALRLQDHARGRQVLELFGMERVIRFDPVHLEPIIELAREYESLRNHP
ncbi:MAG: PhnD/SsuA/transferrin family substrate-binding protein [Candidatus Latescibacteria bacterium]|nr:PhnD/SsuA/transferrin family substrate-binding protein [Candidatus Latescibacterota bacterium]